MSRQESRELRAIAHAFGMSDRQRKQFGRFLEAEKAARQTGSKNDRGDFTWTELHAKAQEFLARER